MIFMLFHFVHSYLISYICMLQISISFNFNWYIHFHTYIYMIWLCLFLQCLYFFKAQIMFMWSLILFQMLIGIFTSLYIDFNWYLFGINMYFMFHLQLVSKSTIGMLKFFLQMAPIFVLLNYYLILLIS